MRYISPRKILLSIALLAIVAVAYSLFAQVYQRYEPCPLCIVQRVLIAAIGILSLIFALHFPKNWLIRVYGAIITLLSLFCLKVALHHDWLLSLPKDQQPMSCGAPLGFLYKHLPLNEFIDTVMKGDASCSQVVWKVVGVSAPIAVTLFCIVLAILSLLVVFTCYPKKSS